LKPRNSVWHIIAPSALLSEKITRRFGGDLARQEMASRYPVPVKPRKQISNLLIALSQKFSGKLGNMSSDARRMLLTRWNWKNVMSVSLKDNLPGTLLSVKSRPLFVMRLDVRPYQIVGGPESAFRRIGVVPGGIFQGERLSGRVREGGSDWQVVRTDGKVELDVRLMLETDDGALIGMTYKGIRRGPADVLTRVDRGDIVDPSEYYFRTQPIFETASSYSWINGIVAIGIGSRTAEGVVYSVFEIL